MASTERSIMPAELLRLEVGHQERTLVFSYDIDGHWRGSIRVTYPFHLNDADLSSLPAIGLGVGIFIGQLCLAREIHLGFDVSHAMINSIAPLAEMLYDAHCWNDGLDLMDIPRVTGLSASAHTLVPSPLEPQRACLLWSGGKDSTASAVILRKNEYDILPLHVTVNARVEAEEQRAVAALAGPLAVTYDVLEFEFPEYLELSRAYARAWDVFPAYNTVAFGRDMLLALLACLYMRHTGALHLSIGHGYDCKTAMVDYRGKTIPQNDVESVGGALALERFIRGFVLPDARLLPPIAGMPEFLTLREMILEWPTLFSKTSCCFWGGRCGRCAKCLRYYLVQRLFDRESLVEYATNPLAGEHCPDLLIYVERWQDEQLLFRKQVLYCLGKLVQAGDVREGETLLARFRGEVYPYIADNIETWGQELTRVYREPQIPIAFRAP
jgi:7-cyano-7-deazaguanine synthase in queuosine biosynthesis